MQNSGLFWEGFRCCFLNVHVGVYVGEGKTEEGSLHLEWKLGTCVVVLVFVGIRSTGLAPKKAMSPAQKHFPVW